MTPRVCLVSASGQNVFFGELFDALAEALSAAGLVVERVHDRFPAPQDDLVNVVVPHEFLPLVMPAAHPSEAQIKRTVAISTEQPGTQWFDIAADFAQRAGAVVDINWLGVSALQQRGIVAGHLQLGYVPSWDRWGGDLDADRPVAATFLGGYTPRRGQTLARCAAALVHRRAALRLAENRLPHAAGDRRFLAGDAKWRLLAQTNVLLNIHRDPLAYLEWQRFVEAMINGSVVLSEHSLGCPPLVPGEHFFSATAESLPHVLSTLLEDPERVRRVRESAYRLLRDEYPLARTVEPLLDAIERVARHPLPRSVHPSTGPLPRRLEPPPTELERIARERTELDVVRMGVKQIMLDQRDLRRRIVELREQLDGVEPARDVVRAYGPADGAAPRVSVVLTVYNYASHVGAAIESVAASDFDAYELVIVEDRSTDDSLDVIERTLEHVPWLRATVIARGRNQGLPRGRNLGIERARGEYVFILDADNMIYPHALSRLTQALDEAPDAKFAYGIIEQFNDAGPVDLVSFLPWDPERLRYGNYIDAMAMLRRSAVEAVGGYLLDPRLYGWEDFALWCAFAQRGWTGVLVPEILTRYRTSMHSMLALTNIDGTAAWGALAERFPFLAGSALQHALDGTQGARQLPTG